MEQLRAEVQRLRNGHSSEVEELRRDVSELREIIKELYRDPDLVKRFKEDRQIDVS